MQYSFVILTWNRSNYLKKVIPALYEAIDNHADAEILLMDNASTDETPAVMRELSARYTNVKTYSLTRFEGLNAYKKLFPLAKGRYIIELDDDVLAFPKGIDKIFEDYMLAFRDFGYLALNVIQNEHTNGSKPPADHYTLLERNGKYLEAGDTGGWCSCFRKKDYRKIKIPFRFTALSFTRPEDGQLQKWFKALLRLKSGIIRDHYCLHASGPYYASQFANMDREIEKYQHAGLSHIAQEYIQYKGD